MAIVNEMCRHLGVPGDKQVRFSYPNSLNVCYAARDTISEFLPVEPDHQREYCLTYDHLLCPIYLRQVVATRGDGTHERPPFLEFFGLSEEPFSIVPQPRFLADSRAQQEAHAALRWLIKHKHGLGLLYGPVGTGKTLLCRAIAEELAASPTHVVGLMLTPSPKTEYAFMSDLLISWGMEPKRRRSLQELETETFQFLVRSVLDDALTLVLIVDEAHLLSKRVLQQIYKMLNWHEGDTQLLQVILSGQPALQAQVARHPALYDRVVVDLALTAMTPTDVQRMVGERLRRAGRQGDLFAPSALQLIYQHARGTPRRVMILCLLSMWLAYQRDVKYITQDVVKAVVEHNGGEPLFAGSDADLASIAASWSNTSSRQTPTWLPRFLHPVWQRLAA